MPQVQPGANAVKKPPTRHAGTGALRKEKGEDERCEKVSELTRKHIINTSDVKVTQVDPIYLDDLETFYFLNAKVKVDKLKVVKNVNGVAEVRPVEGDVEEMTRLDLYKRTLEWLVQVVLGRPEVEDMSACIALLDQLGGMAVCERYVWFVMNGGDSNKEACAGYYAQGMEADDCLLGILKKSGMDKDDHDLLSHVYTGKDKQAITGVSRSLPWGYSGVGGAGSHTEDDDLHGDHWVVDYQLNVERLTPEDAQVARCMRDMSVRCWVFVLDTCTPQGAMEAEKSISKAYNLREPSYWARILNDRAAFLDPRGGTDLPRDKLKVLYQKPGECLEFNVCHCVLGVTGLSLAWNACKDSHLLHYVACEFNAAMNASDEFFNRCKQQPGYEWDNDKGLSRGLKVPLSLTQEIVYNLQMLWHLPEEVEAKFEGVLKLAYEFEKFALYADVVDIAFESMPQTKQMAIWLEGLGDEESPRCNLCAAPLLLVAVYCHLPTSFLKPDAKGGGTLPSLLCGRCGMRLKDMSRTSGMQIALQCVSIRSPCSLWRWLT